MREAAFVLFVVFLLAGLTALRYRKQIAALLAVGRALREARDPRTLQEESGASTTAKNDLIRCSRCGVWVPEQKAISRAGAAYCSASCLTVPAGQAS